MIVMTRARAALDKMPTPSNSRLVGMMFPDDLPSRCIGFASLELLEDLIATMHPRTVTVVCALERDRVTLQASLETVLTLARMRE